MFKILWLMKRKPGTSMQDLIDYYEGTHAVLGTEFWKRTKLAPKKYMRRYLHPAQAVLTPAAEPGAEPGAEAPYDVATEMWFDRREDFDMFMAAGTTQAAMKLFIDDELRFLDRETTVTFILEEHETDLSAIG